MKKLFSFWKRLLSHRKKEWTLSDYPVHIIKQEKTAHDIPGYRAAIGEWLLMGFGETKQESLDNLQKNFDKFLQDRPNEVPRPGTMMALESYFAEHQGIDNHFETAEKFTESILGFAPGGPFFISDESCLSDFEDSEKDPIDYVGRTKEVFGVDISDIEDGYLLRIFERIDEADPNSVK